MTNSLRGCTEDPLQTSLDTLRVSVVTVPPALPDPVVPAGPTHSGHAAHIARPQVREAVLAGRPLGGEQRVRLLLGAGERPVARVLRPVTPPGRPALCPGR